MKTHVVVKYLQLIYFEILFYTMFYAGLIDFQKLTPRSAVFFDKLMVAHQLKYSDTSVNEDNSFRNHIR